MLHIYIYDISSLRVKAQSCINTRLPFSSRQLSFCPTHMSCRIIPEVTLGATYSRRDPSNKNSVIFINNQLDPQFFFVYVYFYSLHVSGRNVPIIRRTVSMSLIQTCIPNDHLYRVTYTRCHTVTIKSPDDEHMAPETCRE